MITSISWASSSPVSLTPQRAHDGRVAAIGTHAELMATVPGYLNLVTAYEQAEAERDLEDSGVTA